jgi:hypothetical protein
MSNITGSAPVVYAQTIANGAPGGSAPFSDTDAVNHLLNFTQSRSWANYTQVNMAVNTSNLMLAQSANKSLIVAYNTQISTITTNVTNYSVNANNSQVIDTLGFNKTASTILTTESFQMMSVSPDDGIIYNTDESYPLSLEELPTNANEFNGLDNMRILNMTVASNFSINYSATNVQNALGVEGKVYYFNSTTGFAPQYQAISGYQPLSTNSVTLNVSTLNTLNEHYDYQLVKLSYDNPTFNMVGVNAGANQVVSAFGGANLTPLIPSGSSNAFSYTGFLQSLNYTGLLGENISGVLSSTLSLGLSNSSNVTQAFSFASGSQNLIVNPTFVSISNLTTLAQANTLVFDDSMSVQITPSNVSAALSNNSGPVLNGVSAIITVPTAELLPSGKATDNITINTISTQADRKTVTDISFPYNTTCQIQYATDPASMLYPTVLGNNGDPDFSYQLTDQLLQYNVTMFAPSTTPSAGNTAPPDPAGFNVTANKDGLYAIYNLNASYDSTFNVSSVVVVGGNQHANIIGRLDSSSRMNFERSSDITSIQLPYLINSNFSGAALNTTVAMNAMNATFVASYNLLLDSQPSNDQIGFGVLGGSIQSAYGDLYASEKRLLLAPTDPLNNQTTNVTSAINCTNTNSSGLFVAPSLNYGYPLNNIMNASHTLEYRVEWNGLGPVSYEDFTSGTYTQEYNLIFPSANDVANGNLRVQGARIDAYDNNGQRINTRPSYNVTLNRANITGLCLNSCAGSIPGVQDILVTCNVLVDVSLSGLKPFDASAYGTAANLGSMFVNIPLSYTVTNTNGVYSWPNGIVPEMKVRVNFNSNHLYTHRMSLQGQPDPNAQWADLDTSTQTNQSGQPYNVTCISAWYVDLRESYDILTYTASELYNLNVCLYPQQDDQADPVYNSPFIIPLSTAATGWTGVYCDLTNSQVNRDLLRGLSLSQIQYVLDEPMPLNVNNIPTPAVKIPLTTTVTDVGNGAMVTVTDGQVTFQVNIGQTGRNSSVYFMYVADALIGTKTESTTVPPYYANFMFYNNSYLPIDAGVYISSGTVTSQGRSVGQSIATITVLPDSYNASAYSGQNPPATTPLLGQWVGYEFASPTVLDNYSFQGSVINNGMTAWTIVGSNDGGLSWTVIDQVSGASTAGSYNRSVPSPANTQAYSRMRWICQASTSPFAYIFTNKATWRNAVQTFGGPSTTLQPIAYTRSSAPGDYIGSSSAQVYIDGSTTYVNTSNYPSGTYVGTSSTAIVTGSGNSGPEPYNSTARIGGLGMQDSNFVLIPSALTSPVGGVTTEMLSSISRGYPTATYVFNRSNMGLTATFGAYNQSLSITPPTLNNPTAITLAMNQPAIGYNFNILLSLIAASTSNQTTVFTANKTMVNVSYNGDMYSYHTSPSLPTSVKVLNMVDGIIAQVPWIETLYLNNFFVAGASNTLNVNYNQAPLLVSINNTSYQCTNTSIDASTFVTNLVSYTPGQPPITDAALVSNAYKIVQDQVSFTYSPSYVLRNTAKSFYVTVAPVDVRLTHNSGMTVNSGLLNPPLNRYIQLSSNVIPGYTLPVDTLNAPYAINVGFDLSQFKADGLFPSSAFEYKSKLYSLRGSADGATNWYTYFSEVDFTDPVFPDSTYQLTTYSGSPYNGFYNLSFLQNGYNVLSGDEVNLVFSSSFIRSVYGALPPSGGSPYSGWTPVYDWSQSITVVPATSSFLAQYELTFALNPTTKLINPVITKYVSTSFPSDYLGAPGQLNTTNGYYNNQACASALLMTSPSAVTVAGYPYQFQSASQYPALSSGTFASVTFSSGGITPPPNIDFIYQVTNGNTGANLYRSILSVVPGNFLDCKILNIFAKDQFVVQDYRGNLAMRVGPDGRFYAGDVSTYSVALIDNQSPVCNGLYVPVFNSDMNLRPA